MKRFTALVIGVSVALTAVARAQAPAEEQGKDKKNRNKGEAQHAAPAAGAHQQAGRAQRSPGAQQPTARAQTAAPAQAAGRPHGTSKAAQAAAPTNAARESSMRNANVQRKQQKNAQPAAATSGAATQATAAPEVKKQAQRTAAAMKASPAPAPSVAPSVAAAPTAAPLAAPNAQTNARGAAKTRPAPEQVQQIRSRYANFRAQPRPERAPAVRFNQNYRIQNAQQWQGPQYQVFRSYNPQWHDRRWYRSHYSRVELIAGGYYYWNNGYWFPAWGYDPGVSYYSYDGPIYVGARAEPFDRVVADVQAELQQMGYYRGEVDGLVGPLTREALTAYQADHGLYRTAAIDQPTLDALGLG